MSSINDYQFKKFQNTTRTFSSEEQFNLGMNYTDSPIESGQSKILLNFDISDDGVSLKPRAGIKVSSVAVLDTDITPLLFNVIPNAEHTNISAIGDYIYDGITYKYVVLHDTATNKIFLCTIANDIEVTAIEELDCLGMQMIDTELTAKYNDYSNMEIHDLKISPDTPASKQQVGTKAWNGSYFFFATDTSGESALYNTKFNTETKRFYINKVIATQLTALEASPNKFNMLLKNPYEFVNSYVAGAFVLQGILPYENDVLVVSPRINTKYRYKLNYTVPSGITYTIKWEWKDYSGTEWTELKSEAIPFTSTTPPEVYCDFATPIKESLMRVTVTKADTTYPEQVSAIAINCDTEVQQATANSGLKNYDLAKAKGMCYWQNRLVLWGFDDPLIFVSDTNLPEWFPYPNNTDLFEEPIIHCEPYLDTLLVFTTQKLFQLSMLSDGSGWSKTCIQDHLRLTQYDTNFIKTIKNMVVFKSGNSYFMIVPSSITAAGLTIAPISKPIQWLLDNFNRDITAILKDVYSYEDKLTLEYCYNYINNADIVIDYMFKDIDNIFLNICLLYDTEARTWRIHLFESQGRYVMYKLDATTDGTLATLINVDFRFNNTFTGTYMYRTAPLIQFLNKTNDSPNDYYIPNGLKYYPEIKNAFTDGPAPAEFGDINILFNQVHKYKNYQFIDTGYRALGNPNHKKRHREFQLRFNNKSEQTLNFGTSFYIDGEDRRNMYKYKVVHNVNPESKDYGLIEVVPELETLINVHSATMLGETQNDINAWELGVSAFPQIPLVKARVGVSGKGYNNRLKLLSINEKNYEILGLCWVYKIKNLR